MLHGPHGENGVNVQLHVEQMVHKRDLGHAIHLGMVDILAPQHRNLIPKLAIMDHVQVGSTDCIECKYKDLWRARIYNFTLNKPCF